MPPVVLAPAAPGGGPTQGGAERAGRSRRRPRRAAVLGFAAVWSGGHQGAAAVAADSQVAQHYGSFEAPSLSNTTYEDVRELLLQGRPFVVVDGARGLPMASWDCDYVRREFPKSRMFQEGGGTDINDVPMDSDWANKQVPFKGVSRFPEGAPRNRPFYWDIVKAWQSEGHRKWGEKPKAVVDKLVSSSSVPYFLPPQEAQGMGYSSELWFHPPGAGAPAHMDPHCRTTVSFCFSGKRKWRMMIPPVKPHPGGYFDGEIYGAKDPRRKGEWQPIFELEAPAGSAVVLFPGMVHETVSTGEQCSSSISQTFETPLAAAYYRAFWPRLALNVEDVGGCGPVVEGLVNLGSGMRVPTAKEKIKQASAEFVSKVDADGDGTISEAEMLAVRRRPKGELTRPPLELVSFHDTNKDGVVSTQEVKDSWDMFSKAGRAARAWARKHGHGGEL